MSSLSIACLEDAGDLSNEDYLAAARASFLSFFLLTFHVLHPGEKLADARYFDLIDHMLHACEARRHRRVILNMPPGYMKSTLVSVYYTAWLLGRDPTVKIICASYGDDLSHLLSRRVRQLMSSPLYRRIFSGTVLTKKSEDLLVTSKGGYRYATAVCSDITGFRADFIIVDDPIQPVDASSESAKQKVVDWFDSSVLSRFKNASEGVLILVMHRVALDDLSGVLEARDGWLPIKLPLIAEKDERFTRKEDKLLLFERPVGELLCPARMSLAEYENFKAETAPHVFAAQYQQRPTLGGSGMCSIDRLVRYDQAPPFELVIHSWDVAATPGGDHTVCTQWGVAKCDSRDALFLTNIIRMRVESPDVRDAIIGQDREHQPDLIVVDGVGVGLSIYQDLNRRGMRHVMRATSAATEASAASKLQKLNLAVLEMYDGTVRFPESGQFLDAFFSELAAFPNGKYDDQVDSMTQVVAYLPSVLMYARQKRRLR